MKIYAHHHQLYSLDLILMLIDFYQPASKNGKILLNKNLLPISCREQYRISCVIKSESI